MNTKKLDVYELIKDKLKLGIFNVPYLVESEITEIDTSALTKHDRNKNYINTVVNYIENEDIPMVKINALGNKSYTYSQIFGYVITNKCKFGLVVRNEYDLKQILLIFPSDLNFVMENYKTYLEIPSYSFTLTKDPVLTSLEFQVAKINKSIDEDDHILYYKAVNPVANNDQNFMIKIYNIVSVNSEIAIALSLKELMNSVVFTDWLKVNDDGIITLSLFRLDSPYDIYSYDDHFNRLKKLIKQYYKVKYPENHKEKSKDLIKYLKDIIKNSIPLQQTVKVSHCDINIR